MSQVAIRVEGLGKRYRIGHRQEQYRTIRDAFAGALAGPVRRMRSLLGGRAAGAADADAIWALQGVSFEVGRGEVVGIIGRNGAGKSTLLKILSRITEPTEGWADIHGRVGSLLEVGTGFHPELTGRENIYLNGAILGMRRVEIERKFADIVAFAEVEKFIDTPVKHYSSGMYVRLAFAVAAHLETEILLVDEVLAVGDAFFQEKCLGRMSQVAQSGRTVFFVSHSMSAVRRLCTRVIWLKEGGVYETGEPEEVINNYLLSALDKTERVCTTIPREASRSGDGRLMFTGFAAASVVGEELLPPRTGSPVLIELGYELKDSFSVNSMYVAINIRDARGQNIASLGNRYTGERLANLPAAGAVICEVPRLPLLPGRYFVDLVCRVNDITSDKVIEAATIKVHRGDFFGTHHLPDPRLAAVVFDHSLRVGEGTMLEQRTEENWFEVTGAGGA